MGSDHVRIPSAVIVYMYHLSLPAVHYIEAHQQWDFSLRWTCLQQVCGVEKKQIEAVVESVTVSKGFRLLLGFSFDFFYLFLKLLLLSQSLLLLVLEIEPMASCILSECWLPLICVPSLLAAPLVWTVSSCQRHCSSDKLAKPTDATSKLYSGDKCFECLRNPPSPPLSLLGVVHQISTGQGLFIFISIMVNSLKRNAGIL